MADATRSSAKDGVEVAEKRPLCFVISQIGEDKSAIRDRADKVLRHVIAKALDSKYRIERADEIGKAGLITVQIIQRLAGAELVVADLTGGNPNVYYELALRHLFAKPVVHVIERGEKAPFDVSPMRYVDYDLKDPDVLDAARAELVRQVEAMEKGEKVVTLVQVARVFAEESEGKGDMSLRMFKAIYGAVSDLRRRVEERDESLAAQFNRVAAGLAEAEANPFGVRLGRGSAVAEINKALAVDAAKRRELAEEQRRLAELSEAVQGLMKELKAAEGSGGKKEGEGEGKKPDDEKK